MKLAFIQTYDFPVGGAAQNRALGICRGIIEQGHKVEVHVVGAGRLDIPLNKKESQIYKSVQIYNHSWRWAPAKGKLKRFFGIAEGFPRMLIALIKSHRVEPYDYIFSNNNRNIYNFPIFILTKLFKARLGRDLSEYPPTVLFWHRYNALSRYISHRTNYCWFDDFFIMTKKLINFYRPLAKKNARFLHLPMTVDFDRFPYPVSDLSQARDITYCGDLSQAKDGVLTLIKAYALIKDEFPNTRLKLIGNNKDAAYIINLNKLIVESGLSNRVIQPGYIYSEQIPGQLYTSRLLVLSRPDNIQTRGGFPTKLGEYLATGVPVAVTSVGEISDYLLDGENAFIAKPDCVESFADAMRRALSDEKFSLKVGLAGRETAIAHFSHHHQGKLLVNFLKAKAKL